MSDSAGILVAIQAPLFVAVAIAFVYAGYWGLAIGRGLHARAFRNQAFGVGITAFYVVIILAISKSLPVSAGTSPDVVLLSALVDLGLLAVLLYWVNSTASIARKSDPFERDTLHYSVTRYAWLTAIALPIIASLIYNPLVLLYTVPANLDFASSVLGITPLIITASFGSILMALSASRSKDRTLTTHVRWYARSLAVTVVIFVIDAVWRATGSNSSPYLLPLTPLFFGGLFGSAYCFYRSAKSLAPTTKTL